LTFVRSLKGSSLADGLANPRTLKVASLMNAKPLADLITRTSTGANSGYLQRIFAVEAITRTVQDKRRALAQANYRQVEEAVSASIKAADPRAD
jgi:hypothetical protein